MKTELFRSDNVRVVPVTFPDSKICFVTFTPFSDTPDIEKRGFAEEFFRKRGISAIHVISKENGWYQDRCMPDVTALIRHAATGQRIVTYGSSMGGYAAIRFADWLEADCAIAISAQGSVNPRVAHWETHWTLERDAIPQFWDEIPEVKCDVFAFYDPKTSDKNHVDYIARHATVHRIKLPFAGHPAGSFLNDLGLLSQAVIDIAERRFDQPLFMQKVRERRKSSSNYICALSQTMLRRNIRTKLHLARISEQMAPDGWFKAYVAMVEASMGNPDKAELYFQKAIEAEPQAVRYRVWYDEYKRQLAHKNLGDDVEGEDAAERLALRQFLRRMEW